MRLIILSRWFGLADLICVAAGVVLWEIRPELGWRQLTITLLPWLLRLLVGKFPFQRTHFDLALALFLVTAGVGVWAAYDREAAWAKFWLLVGAVLLFYAFAGQPQANRWFIAAFLALVGVGVAGYFLLTHDWQVFPAKVSAIQQVALWWMQARPAFGEGGVHPNDAAGISVMLSPWLLAIGWRAWRSKRLLLLALIVAGAFLILVAFILSTSRGAWMAAGAALGLLLLWRFSQFLASGQPARQAVIFDLTVLLAIGGLAWLLLSDSESLVHLGDALPGPPAASNRLAMARGAWFLFTDAPLTGGGLASFPGLYAQYVIMTPNLIVPHSHNLFLDVAFEQGIFGLLAWVWILIGSLGLLLRSVPARRRTSLRTAVLAGLLVLLFHGLADDLVFYTQNAPLLFLLPGVAVSLSSSQRQAAPKAPRRLGWAAGLPAFICLFIFAWVNGVFRSLPAVWHAGQGAVEMARVELAGFPNGKWDDGLGVEQLAPAEAHFHTALRYDPDNRTANHRLGLIALQRREFSAAVAHLESARQAAPGHPGIAKALGYCYLWTGQIDLAIGLLAGFADVPVELYNYPLWWRNQGREDLALHAEAALVRLKFFVSPSSPPAVVP